MSGAGARRRPLTLFVHGYMLLLAIVLGVGGAGIMAVWAGLGPAPLIDRIFGRSAMATVVSAGWSPLAVEGDNPRGFVILLPEVAVRADGEEGTLPLRGLEPRVAVAGEAEPPPPLAVGAEVAVTLDGAGQGGSARLVQWRGRVLLGIVIGLMPLLLSFAVLRLLVKMRRGLRAEADKTEAAPVVRRRIGG